MHDELCILILKKLRENLGRARGRDKKIQQKMFNAKKNC
jgi:hypothetical protein